MGLSLFFANNSPTNLVFVLLGYMLTSISGSDLSHKLLSRDIYPDDIIILSEGMIP